jgi:hypothetical protein
MFSAICRLNPLSISAWWLNANGRLLLLTDLLLIACAANGTPLYLARRQRWIEFRAT